jgi:hypothetical protein
MVATQTGVSPLPGRTRQPAYEGRDWHRAPVPVRAREPSMCNGRKARSFRRNGVRVRAGLAGDVHGVRDTGERDGKVVDDVEA